AFLIPYCICVFVCGIPLYFLEAALGQFVSGSVIRAWNLCPLFKGKLYFFQALLLLYLV
ncbi:unnamed protein product, partial [Candidula unifasciata]